MLCQCLHLTQRPQANRFYSRTLRARRNAALRLLADMFEAVKDEFRRGQGSNRARVVPVGGRTTAPRRPRGSYRDSACTRPLGLRAQSLVLEPGAGRDTPFRTAHHHRHRRRSHDNAELILLQGDADAVPTLHAHGTESMRGSDGALAITPLSGRRVSAGFAAPVAPFREAAAANDAARGDGDSEGRQGPPAGRLSEPMLVTASADEVEDKSVAPGEGGSTGRQPQSGTSSRQQSPRQPTAAMSLGSVNSMADAEMAAPPGSTHHSATSSPRSATSGSKPPAALALKKEHFRAATPASDVATPSMLTTRMSASPRPAGGTSLTFRGRAQTPSASQSMRSYRDEHVPAAGDTRPLSTLIVTVLLVLQLWGALFFFVVGGAMATMASSPATGAVMAVGGVAIIVPAIVGLVFARIHQYTWAWVACAVSGVAEVSLSVLTPQHPRFDVCVVPRVLCVWFPQIAIVAYVAATPSLPHRAPALGAALGGHAIMALILSAVLAATIKISHNIARRISTRAHVEALTRFSTRSLRLPKRQSSRILRTNASQSDDAITNAALMIQVRPSALVCARSCASLICCCCCCCVSWCHSVWSVVVRVA